MTVENTQNKMPPLQMGTTNEYPFNFAVLLQDPTAEEALEAIKASVLQADGTEVELVYNTDYTVTLNTDRIGGTLTVNDIRTSGDYITIYRQYAQTQEVDYKDFNSAPAETFEQCFDKLTMLSQQQQEEINRSIKLPVSSDITNLSLPNPVAGRTLKWNESETGLINSDVSIDEIDEFVKSANESAEIAVEKAEEIQGKLDEALEVADTIKDIEIIATLEIGDIGFTQMVIDETKGKRRVLNGQLIIQDQYVQFTNIIKESVALNPSLACTEAEWQTEVTMSTNGVCDKFVIDDNAGTIRLPKYPNYFIAGLTGNAPVVGNGMSLGLTNGTTTYSLIQSNGGGYEGFHKGTYSTATLPNTSSLVAPTSGTYPLYGVTTDPTKSGIEAQIKQEQIKGTYFIQVATGSETEDNIINEIELNNPFSLLDYKYSEYELNNLSWLRSNGQWNSNAIYPAVYELLLKIYNGTETKAGVSVKLSTEAYTDYDFVLNTAEETFRLPILTTNRVLIAKKEATNEDTTWYNLYSDGWCEQGGQTSGYATIQLLKPFSNTSYYANFISLDNANNSQYENYMISDKTTSSFTIGQKRTGLDGGVCNWVACGYAEIPTENNYLYFYVGETVQNANLINAGRIEEKLADCITRNDCKAYITETYQNGTSWYRVYSDGWCEQGGTISGGYVQVQLLKPYANANYNIQATISSTNEGGCSYAAAGQRGAVTPTYFEIWGVNNIGYKFWQTAGHIS